MTGRSHLVWELGKWREKRGGGEVFGRPPAGVTPMTRALDPELRGAPGRAARRGRPVQSAGARSVTFRSAGMVSYGLDPQWITIGPSVVATPKTYVEFEGRTAYGENRGSRFT